MSGRGGSGWNGSKPFTNLSTVWRDGPLVLPEQNWVPAPARPAPSPRESPEEALERVLHLWEDLVGFHLGEVRRRAFLRRLEVRWLSHHPNEVLESVARHAMAANDGGNLLVAEWADALFSHTGDERPL